MIENRPVQVGDELDVTIEAVGEKGDGIAKKDGFVLFVPNASEGDRVRVRITKVLRRVGFAEVVGQAEKPKAAPKEPVPEDTEDFGEEQESENTPDEDLKEE
ncbi:MAG: TRAM domain-containing protein [Candidatus Woesearchaeota archaeon]